MPASVYILKDWLKRGIKINSAQIKRNVHYGLLQSAYWMSQCTVFNYATVFLLSRTIDNRYIGFILAAANLLSVLFQPAVAAFADRSKKVSLPGIIAILAGIALICSAFMLLPLSKLFLGIAYTIVLMIMFSLLPLINAIAFTMDAAHKVNFDYARIAGSLAYALVSSLMGFGVDRYGGRLLIVVNVCLFAAIVLLTISFRYVQEQKVEEASGSPGISEGKDSFIRRNRHYILTLVGLVPVFFCYNLFAAYLIHIVERVGGSNADMGNALAICGFLEIPVLLFYGKLRKKFSDKILFAVSIVAFTAKAFMLTIAGSMGGIYAAECLHAASFALFLPASVYYADQAVSSGDRIKGQALMTTSGTVGSVLATAIGGIILESMGVHMMAIIGTLCSAVGTVLACMVILKKKIRQTAR